MKVLIKNGWVIDPSQGIDALQDVRIVDGRIAETTPPGQSDDFARDAQVFDVDGCWVTPGLIDMHVHLREPGHEYKETVRTGTMAAVAGGFTAVAAMPNTDPVCDDASVIEHVLSQAEKSGKARVYVVAAMTVGSRGEQMCQYAELADAGAVAVSDDGGWVSSGKMMRRVLEYARVFGLTPISHAEDAGLSAGGHMNEGWVATRLGLAGIPAAAEITAVFRDAALAELTKAHLHIAHLSTKGAVDIIRSAKARGVNITCETAPHYFSLNQEAVKEYDTHAKMNPPLRTDDDVAAIRQGLADGTIDCVATDHAPHSILEKDLEFDRAAFGVIGLETALPLALDLVRENVISRVRLVEMLSLNPSRILGVPGGTLTKGSPADITVIDPEATRTCRADEFYSLGRNTPFEGKTMTGRAVLTLVEGRAVFNLAG
jgi:dihydroorotase